MKEALADVDHLRQACIAALGLGVRMVSAALDMEQAFSALQAACGQDRLSPCLPFGTGRGTPSSDILPGPWEGQFTSARSPGQSCQGGLLPGL